MFTFPVAILTAIGYSSCCDATAGLPSKGEIPIGDPLYDLAERLQDPQQVYTWIIRDLPNLEMESCFLKPFQKRNFWDLDTQETALVMARVFQIGDSQDLQLFVTNTVQEEVGTIMSKYFAEERAAQYMEDHPRSKWTGQWSANTIEIICWEDWQPHAMHEMLSRLSIWTQTHQEEFNYLISYQHRGAPHATVWMIGTGNKVLWTTERELRNQIPESSTTFPLLVNSEYASLCALHANYSAIKEKLNQNTETIQQQDQREIIVRWSCLVGAITLVVTVLVMCCGFQKFYLIQQKQWEIQPVRVSSSVRVDNPKAGENIGDSAKAEQHIYP